MAEVALSVLAPTSPARETRCGATTRDGRGCSGWIDPEHDVCEFEDEHHGTAGTEPWVLTSSPVGLDDAGVAATVQRIRFNLAGTEGLMPIDREQIEATLTALERLHDRLAPGRGDSGEGTT